MIAQGRRLALDASPVLYPLRLSCTCSGGAPFHCGPLGFADRWRRLYRATALEQRTSAYKAWARRIPDVYEIPVLAAPSGVHKEEVVEP